MSARTGRQFLDGLRKTPRHLWLGDERIGDVTAHPALAGAARTLVEVFDRQHRFADECLIPDPETGEPINISHMFPRSIEDLKRRNRGLSRIAEATVGLMGRTPDYMNVKFASFAARPSFWAGPDQRNAGGAENLVRFQRRLAREDVSLTHTIIQPTVDKATDAKLVGNRVTLHKVGDTASGILVRGAKVLATLAPFRRRDRRVPRASHPARGERVRARVLRSGRHAGLAVPVPGQRGGARGAPLRPTVVEPLRRAGRRGHLRRRRDHTGAGFPRW
jgi:aromatic ring hydroxylase